jgi:hypothetical protein
MGNLLTSRVGNILTALLGKVLTVGVGKVLDIYNSWSVAETNFSIRPGSAPPSGFVRVEILRINSA